MKWILKSLQFKTKFNAAEKATICDEINQKKIQNAPVAINRLCEGVALDSDDEKEEFKDQPQVHSIIVDISNKEMDIKKNMQ